MEQNFEFKTAYDFANYTSKNLFLTGKAGTGKTTFLHHLKNNTDKNCIIVAPTGVAAINAGGVTIHSMFNLPTLNFAPTNQIVDSNILINEFDLKKQLKFRKEKKKLLKSIQMIIIDEISMVRADLIDAIDTVLRYVRGYNLPFGGVQMVFIGDMFQLPPVIRDEEWKFLNEFYLSPYFFDAKVLRDFKPVCIELKKIYRQNDEKFISILNNVRNQEITSLDLQELNKSFNPNITDFSNIITLTTHNYQAQNINQKELDKLKTPSFTIQAEVSGDFKESMFPCENKLILKQGAQIMFIKNDSDPEKNYYNGKLAKIISIIKDESILIEIEFPENNKKYILKKESWNNIQYKVDQKTGKTKEEIIGTFTQFPVRLAWAVTIHKSQGLTFDKVIIDAQKAFATGQVYVALSRCRTLEGITLNSKIFAENIKTDPKIKDFQQKMANLDELVLTLESEKYRYAIDNIINTLTISSVIFSIDNWKKSINESHFIDLNECKEIHKNISIQINHWNDILRKFKNTLDKYFYSYQTNQMNWQEIEDKCKNAYVYFLSDLNQKMLIPLAIHYSNYKSKTKIKSYLDDLLDLIDELKFKKNQITKLKLLDCNLSDKNINEDKEFEEIEEKIYKKEKKIPNHLKSYHLYKSGKNIKEIAKEIGFTEQTIHNHLIKCFEEDLEIDITNFFDFTNFEYLSYVYESLENKSLKEFYEKCNGQITYEEIKYFIAYYKKLKI